MSQKFVIFYDPEYTKTVNAVGSYLRSLSLIPAPNQYNDTCIFDTNAPYTAQGFYVATAENNKVCYDCALAKDPQILNILNFITTGKNHEAKIKKFELGMEELRRITPVADPNAHKCPICKQRKAYKQSFDGHYGFKCNECQIGYIGHQKFYYNGNMYTLEQAKKIFKMKAFK